MSICKVSVLGNLTADPEQRTTPNGNQVAKFSLAVNSFNSGNKTAMFLNCSMWGKRGEVIAKNMKKGQPLFVSGTLSQSSFTGRDGQTHQSLDVNVDDFSFVGGGRGNAGDAVDTSFSTSEGVDAPAPVSASDASAIELKDIPF